MRISRNLLLCAGVALISAGCEVHERGPDQVGVEMTADASAGPVIDGGIAVDVDPDPAQRVYIYDEGYPPGCYLYDNYYYYGGYRYPRDVFINRYVQENIRQRRFVNADDNRRQGQQIEQRQRADFSKNHGVRQNRGVKAPEQRVEHAPARQEETPRGDVQRQENKTSARDEHQAAVERPEIKAPVKEEHQATPDRPENREPAREERPANAQRQEEKTPANEERRTNVERPENKAKPENEQRKTEGEESKKEEQK